MCLNHVIHWQWLTVRRNGDQLISITIFEEVNGFRAAGRRLPQIDNWMSQSRWRKKSECEVEPVDELCCARTKDMQHALNADRRLFSRQSPCIAA